MRTSFAHGPSSVVNWFPGHMAKAARILRETVRGVDLVVEVRDARIPLTSRSAALVPIAELSRAHLVVYTKSDLALLGPSKRCLVSRAGVGADDADAIYVDARRPADTQRVLKRVRRKAEAVLRGAEFKTMAVRMAVVGLPNTGKSTLLNAISTGARTKGSKVKTGANAGITRHAHFSRVMDNPAVMMLDTPGIMPPGNNLPDEGLKIALTGGVRVNLVDALTLADFCLFHLNATEQFEYVQYYGLPEPCDSIDVAVAAVARRLGATHSSEEAPRLDVHRAAEHFVRSYQTGKLGPSMLDWDFASHAPAQNTSDDTSSSSSAAY